ncbi:MAG: hypothetical protein BWY45_02324 [Euryarchaeota archaeon ADurb.Bin294]|nr:MAG: hypothetical protein BWY45_02324 [Euryarchaeota archaeon ADurb.Bin294]
MNCRHKSGDIRGVTQLGLYPVTIFNGQIRVSGEYMADTDEEFSNSGKTIGHKFIVLKNRESTMIVPLEHEISAQLIPELLFKGILPVDLI